MAKIKEPKMAKPLNVKPVFRVPFSATTIPTKSQSPGSIHSFHQLSSPNIIPQSHLCSLCKHRAFSPVAEQKAALATLSLSTFVLGQERKLLMSYILPNHKGPGLVGATILF